jgi:hypothetical protein
VPAMSPRLIPPARRRWHCAVVLCAENGSYAELHTEAIVCSPSIDEDSYASRQPLSTRLFDG